MSLREYWENSVSSHSRGRDPSQALPEFDRAPVESMLTRGALSAAVAILICGITISLLAANWSQNKVRDEGELLFDTVAERLTTELHRRVNLPVYGLLGARGTYMATDKVERLDFRAYVESRDLPKEFPGAIGFGLIERVMREDLETFLARERADSAPEFTIRTVGNAPDLYVITYIDPLDRNLAAWGYDVGSERTRREAIEKAVRTGEPTLTARIDLVQEDYNAAGFLLLVPFYEKGNTPTTPAKRFDKLVGILYAPIVIDDALAGIATFTEDQLLFNIYDGDSVASGDLLFDFRNHRSNITGLHTDLEEGGGAYRTNRTIVVGGRDWTIEMTSAGIFDDRAKSSVPILTGGGGIILSLLLAAVVWSLGRSRARALSLATAMTRDLADAKELADTANRSKSEFLANMSHEIRTPLTAILGYTDVLGQEIEEKAPSKRAMEAMKTIESAGEHLLMLINDILDLSKIEAGKLAVEQIETPLMQVLHEIDSMMRVRIAGKGVELRTIVQNPLPERILSDPTRLRQILVNVVGNAAKFTETGWIELRVRSEEQRGERLLQFEIEDTGPGMTEEQVTSLFAPFTQADTSVTRKFGGTGLGLTISRRLSALMGGELRLTKTILGEGSCFVLELPLVSVEGATLVTDLTERTERRPAREGEADAPIAGRVLLAEDNPVNQRLVSHYLRKAGAEVAVADNGKIALSMLEAAEQASERFDLLLTDMQMPEMDGYTLATELRRKGSTIPIVALTAHAMADDNRKCLEAGCDAYASKPINRAALIEICREWLGREAGSA